MKENQKNEQVSNNPGTSKNQNGDDTKKNNSSTTQQAMIKR
jgi:hypothetical protein